MNRQVTRITFDNESKDLILDAFNKSVDKDGFIIEKQSKVRVLTPEGMELKKDRLSIIKKGSEKFISGDLTSLMKYAKGEI